MNPRNAKLLKVALPVCLLLAGWLWFNPPGRFGWCCFGLTTYGGWPRPIADLQIKADGSLRKVPKTHALPLDQIQWLIEPLPETLIISTGWNGVLEPDEPIKKLKGVEVRILKSKEAAELFNQLKKAGKRVAIHFHSTC